VKVLYVNHTSAMSGGERSLLALITGLPADVGTAVACPAGPLADAVASIGATVHLIPGTAGSLKLHPWYTARALTEMGRATVAVRQLARRVDADLVHANSIRAGMVATAGARLGGPPAVVHVRDCLPPGRASSLTRRLIGQGATVVVANSRHTLERFMEPGFAAAGRVAYSPVDLERFDPDRIDREEARAELGLGAADVALAVVAQITPWKAQDDAVRMLARLKESHPRLRLLLVGSPKFVSGATRYDNPGFLRSLERLIESTGLEGRVSFLGEREDVPRVLRAADILLAPSWEEPFGRSIVEAMALGVPVVATSVGGPAEIVGDGREGLLLPPRSPGRWAEAVARLADRPEERATMGAAGRERAARVFGVEPHVRAVLAAYREALSPPAR
jgi:L-malate glycosyltransferase